MAHFLPLYNICILCIVGSTPTSMTNDRFELHHGGRKSTESDSPKSSSHDESASGTPDLGNNNNNHNNHKHHHGTIDNNQGGGSGNLQHHAGIGGGGSPQIIVSSAPAGFPTHLSSLASYYSQLNQVQGMPGTTLAPSLAHMAQYGQLPTGQNPYGSIAAAHHQSSTGTNPNGPSAAASDFRRALPVIF